MNETVDAEYEMLALFELTPDLVCIAGADGYFRKINPAVSTTLGYSESELFSRPISSFIHPDDRELTGRERRQLLKGKTLLNFQNRYVKKDGSTVWLEWTSVFLPEKKIVFAIAKDISEKKQREKETEEKFDAYKSMATHFKNRAEENRKYLAHELHEEVAQLAATVKMQVASLAQEAALPDECKSKMEKTLILSDILVKTIRRISFSVSPAMLDDLGFVATLEWECNEFSVLNGIPCRLEADCDESRVPKTSRLDLYRICQEALNNIMEHAQAKSVEVSLNDHQENLVLKIADDGRGFNPVKSVESPGLLNMRQLAQSINAQLEIESNPGAGTVISIVLPITG